MKVRSCIKCRVYVVLKEGSVQNQKAIRSFEKDHIGHILATVDYNEVKDEYKSQTNEYMEKA
nr:hypothetical protein [Candidatus Sigynarchaeota archaeon]